MGQKSFPVSKILLHHNCEYWFSLITKSSNCPLSVKINGTSIQINEQYSGKRGLNNTKEVIV